MPGKPGRCVICRSRHLLEIDKWILADRPKATIVRRFTVSRSSLIRHIASGHVQTPDGPLPPPKPKTDTLADAETETVYEALARELEAMLENAGSTSQRLAILSEQRRLAADRARVEGPGPLAEVRVKDVDGLNELFGWLHELLKPYPEARVALAEKIKEQRLAVATEA